MEIVNFTEARKSLREVLDRVVADQDYTVHLLRSPANATHLEQSTSEYRQGKFRQQSLIDE